MLDEELALDQKVKDAIERLTQSTNASSIPDYIQLAYCSS